MTKRTLIVAVALALALIGTGCKSSSTALDAPVVSKQATNDGGTLHLTWEAVEGAESYEIKAGGAVDTITSTSFDVSTPAATIEVRSVKGTSKSDSAATIECGIVESTIEFFGDLDTLHFNGFGFGSNGTAVGYTMHPTQLPNLDFYAEGNQSAMKLKSAAGVNSEKKGNGTKVASVAYDDVGIADPVGDYADSSLTIAAGTACCLRMSSDTTAAGTWTDQDHFAKANVVSIESTKVTLKVGYQKVAGLRWLAK